MSNHWEPNICSDEPKVSHTQCTNDPHGYFKMGEHHIVGGGGPDTDICCTYWVCDGCGLEIAECNKRAWGLEVHK